MLKESWKSYLVLICFSFFLHDVLISTTMAFVGLGFILISFNIKLAKVLRNLLAISVFLSYWLKYGKIIDPEIGLNFLTSIVVLKLLELESKRDRYMIFFGLLLLISAGSLFEKTLSYVLFFSFSFFVLMTDFYQFIGHKFKIREFLLSLIWVIPFTMLLFFFIPRLISPISFNQNTQVQGEVGYTPDVNISETESLTGNQSVVFQAVVDQELNQNNLYWRGNTLSYNDGWNWKLMVQDKKDAQAVLGYKIAPEEIKQSIRLYSSSDFFFSLDRPRIISFGDEIYRLNTESGTMDQSRWKWEMSYDVVSSLSDPLDKSSSMERYLQVPLSRSEKERYQTLFTGSNLNEISSSIQAYLRKENFSYSLSPGRVTGLGDFLLKKTGFCSHYASAAALILRIKGIPTRLVSGFMGGTYNKYASFYLITQNDAHVWVEAWNDGKWIRIDPTEWIAPDRVLLGGAVFVTNAEAQRSLAARFLKVPAFVQELRLWFNQWDFYFYHWLDQTDYNTQEGWLKKLKIKRKWLFSIIPAVIIVFILSYWIYVFISRKGEAISPLQGLWLLFYERMHSRNVHLSSFKIKDAEDAIRQLNNNEIHEVWKDLVAMTFADRSISIREMKKRIQKI